MSADLNEMKFDGEYVESLGNELKEEQKDAQYLCEQKKRYDSQTVEMVVKGIYTVVV